MNNDKSISRTDRLGDPQKTHDPAVRRAPGGGGLGDGLVSWWRAPGDGPPAPGGDRLSLREHPLGGPLRGRLRVYASAMGRSPRPTAGTRWAARFPPSPRRAGQGTFRETIGLCSRPRGSSTRSRIAMVVSCIRRRAGTPRAASSPGTRPRSSSWSVPGGRAFAYLIEHDGFLFQSPITWYAQKQRWDLSPGYEKSNLHFDRPVNARLPVLPREPGRAGGGHGQPVSATDLPGPRDRLRAVPRARRAPRRESRDGRRPGHDDRQPREPGALAPGCGLRAMPPDRRSARCASWTVGMRTIGPGCRSISSGRCSSRPRARRENRVVGQVEQMHESRCFRASRGRLGCISCHDPHQLPTPEEKVAYYRDRCLECHADRGCSLPADGPARAKPR